jgi:hypothetical protein
MSLQSILNLANFVSFDRRKVVGIQYTRNETARTELTPTKNPWRFTISVPSLPYYIMRPILERLTTIDRYTNELVTFNTNINTRHIFRQQSNVTFGTPLNVVSFSGNSLVVNNLPLVPVGTVLLSSGDLIQISGHPYPFTVSTDVLMPATASVTITTHRPNIITTSVVGQSLIIGSTCQFNVFCPNMPNYKLVPGNKLKDSSGNYINASLVEFDSEFQYYEWLQDS